MRIMPRSLVGRIALGFLLSYVGVLAGLVVVIEAASSRGFDPYRGSDTVLALLSATVRPTSDGGFRFVADPAVTELAKRNPGMWYAARTASHAVVVGPAPAWATAQMRVLPFETWEDVLINTPSRRSDGVIQYISIEGEDTRSGPMLLAAGGVEPSSPSVLTALKRWHSAGLFWFLLGLAVIGLVVVGVISSIALRTIQPLTRAVRELDPDTPGARLSLKIAARELVPTVTAFNETLDRAEAIMTRRRRFMADVAHEFRTPLAVLSMHAETLRSNQAKTDIQRGLFRLTQMIGQMLDSERLGVTGRTRGPVDLVALSKAAIADIAPVAVDAGYEMALENEALVVWVQGDSRAIERAVTNLLGNAVAHAGGRGVITVRVFEDGIVEVADQGAGLAPDAGERVFDPFHRERWDLDGCGLGLHLVREVMTAHGGRADVVNAGVGGAVFRLTFPVAQSAAGTPS